MSSGYIVAVCVWPAFFCTCTRREHGKCIKCTPYLIETGPGPTLLHVHRTEMISSAAREKNTCYSIVKHGPGDSPRAIFFCSEKRLRLTSMKRQRNTLLALATQPLAQSSSSACYVITSCTIVAYPGQGILKRRPCMEGEICIDSCILSFRYKNF